MFDTAEGDDVGVMHLTEVLDFSADNVAPITLSQRNGFDYAGEEGCYITGWGDTGSGGLPNMLQVGFLLFSRIFFPFFLV